MTKHVIALSGGADSTAMAFRLKELHPDRTYELVCTPTGDELPPMAAHWRNLETRLGPIRRLPGMTIFELIQQQRALPNYRMRFCTRMLKIEPFLDYMETLPDESTMYVGLRADEQGRTGMEGAEFRIAYPMRAWGWTRWDVERYLDCQGIAIPDRTDCGMCFYQRLHEWKALLEDYPERYQAYAELEKAHGHTFRSPQRDSWPASLEELKEAFKHRVLKPPRERGRSTMCSWCAR